VCGLQAQVLTAAALGIRARSSALSVEDVRMALHQDRSVVRTWLMRGTLHLVAADDLRWMLAILGPVLASGRGRRRRQLGLEPETLERGAAAIRRILAQEGPLTRYEIVDRLVHHGVTLDPKTQAPMHLIQYAGLQGILCLGPDRTGGEPTYVLLDDWIGRAPAKRPHGAELAQRYFQAFGPATPDDFAAWSGLPAALARAAVTEARVSLEQLTVEERPAFIAKHTIAVHPPAGGGKSVRLVPAFDTYLLGYRRRDLAVPPALERRLQRGGGWIHPAVIVNGRVIGAWGLRQSGKTARITVETLQPITGAVRRAVEAEASDIGRFLALKPTVAIGELAMMPAPRRRTT
jgi:hypothetical protein